LAFELDANRIIGQYLKQDTYEIDITSFSYVHCLDSILLTTSNRVFLVSSLFEVKEIMVDEELS